MTQYCFAVKRGDTFNGVIFEIALNGSPVDLTDASIAIQFRKTYSAPSVLDLSIGHGITVLDATDGKFQIDPRVFTCPVGQYQFEIRLTLAYGVIKTWIGGIATITEDIVRG